MAEKQKRQPERTCAVCRTKASKNQFIKIVRTADEIVIDKNQTINGRGMYVCKKDECIAKAIKSKAINRCFKKEVPQTLYEELKTFEKLN